MDQLSANNNNNSVAAKNREAKQEVEHFQYIVIRLGEEQYGIDIRYIDNIVRMQNITRVPKVPVYLKGVINLRGEVIPVVSIRLKMGLPADEYTRATRIIILKTETSGNLGIVVDEVREVVTLSDDNIERVSYEARDGKMSFINGIGKNGGELISLLDLNAITLEESI
ncbi:MAG: chemotaxis protein CheW [Clostridium sp.]|nr:chemotaxis protein CheW [Acetatifactor muris]MCM1525992.1 chemotaxis protein CheW [Bacteroides sp.]MCM1562248.1 chemotaxis protein CheW [Clostridium sp.]